jgi:hypothetical protein
MGAECQWLWPTPIGLHQYADAEIVNPLLVEAFAQGRAEQERRRRAGPGPFFASIHARQGEQLRGYSAS